MIKAWHGGSGQGEWPEPSGVRVKSWVEREKSMMQLLDKNVSPPTIATLTVELFGGQRRASALMENCRLLYLKGFTKEQLMAFKVDMLKSLGKAS